MLNNRLSHDDLKCLAHFSQSNRFSETDDATDTRHFKNVNRVLSDLRMCLILIHKYTVHVHNIACRHEVKRQICKIKTKKSELRPVGTGAVRKPEQQNKQNTYLKCF